MTATTTIMASTAGRRMRTSANSWCVRPERPRERFFSSSIISSPSSAGGSTGMRHLIFGANTDVGKTVLTAGLVRACGAGGAHYIKPLQCGGSDQGFVEQHAAAAAAAAAPQSALRSASTLYNWETPTSPHAAARMENLPVSDSQVVTALQERLDELHPPPTVGEKDQLRLPVWIETAGGVLSPSSSSPENHESGHAANEDGWGWLTQGDLYRTFQSETDVVMIGDGRLGGISATLSSLESLLSRGYNVSGLLLIETGYSNQSAIREYVKRSHPRPFDSNALLFDNPDASIVSLPQLPPEPEPLTEWYESPEVTETLEAFVHDHLQHTWNQSRSS